MKLLLDNNLSWRMLKLIEHEYPGSEHVSNVFRDRANDLEIAKFASQHQFVVVTKDNDFDSLVSVVPGLRVVRLIAWNESRGAIASMLLQGVSQITALRGAESRLLVLALPRAVD